MPASVLHDIRDLMAAVTRGGANVRAIGSPWLLSRRLARRFNARPKWRGPGRLARALGCPVIRWRAAQGGLPIEENLNPFARWRQFTVISGAARCWPKSNGILYPKPAVHPLLAH